MPPKPNKPSANPAERVDPLTEAGVSLAAEVRCLREVLDDVREDISWITRNGLPVQPLEYVQIKRMARDVTAPDWNERLVVERTMIHPPTQLSGIATPELQRLAEDLQSAVESLMEGQIEPILKAVDEVQTALINAQQPSDSDPARNAAENGAERTTTPISPLENSPAPSVRPGRLF